MISRLTQNIEFNSACRMMGKLKLPEGANVSEYIKKAFNDELKVAGLYSESGVKILGNITEISFSSMDGVVNGEWSIAIIWNSSNGNSLNVSNKYKFRSGLDALTACTATANAFSSAVQVLIHETITNPDFDKLL